MTYEQIMKSNSSRIRKFGGMSESSMYSGISTGDGVLQFDQEPIAYMSERLKPFDVRDYRNPQIVTNTPHTKDIEKRLLERIQPWLIKPEIAYRRVCDSSRTLPYLDRLENVLSPIYSNKLIDNIVRLKIYSPTYYQKILEKQLNFEKYQEFFYLLILIQYVDYHKHEEAFQQIQEGIRNVIDWVRTRVIEDIEYFIQGPTRNANVTLDYEETFKGLISPSNTTKTVTEYLQLTTMQQINDQLNLTRQEANDRKNVYDKNPNIAGSYLLSIDSELNSSLYVNSTKDLVVDCMSIDLGNSNSEQVDLNIHKAELTDKMLHHDPKIASKKLENLMNIYTMFNIKNLLILKSTYKTSLDAFDKIYVVFPGITMDGRFNQVYTTGTLQVSGHFKESDNEKYWEFVPDTDVGIVYNPTTVHVDSFEFYISNTPGSKTNLSYNNFKISTHLNEYFNCPLIVQQLDDLEPNTYIIRMNDIVEGNLTVLPYTFLYNNELKTLQLLPTNYEYDDIPKYNAKKMRKTTQKYEANIYPTQPSTVNVIMDEIREAKFEASVSGEKVIKISLDKPVQPATVQAINKRMAKGEKSWTFRGQTVEFAGKTAEQIVKEFNEREYDVSNTVDFTKAYIDSLTTSTVTYKGVKYSLIKKDGTRMTGEEFFAMLNIENVIDCAERISAELMEEYRLELNRFDKDILPEQVNPVFGEPKPEDFASLTEYYLFLGLFKPDYDYVVEITEDTDTVTGPYIDDNGNTINNHKYSLSDFFTKDSTYTVTSVENPPHTANEESIVEIMEFIPSTTPNDMTGELKTTIVKTHNSQTTTSVILDELNKPYTTGADDYHYEIDGEQFLIDGESTTTPKAGKEITKYMLTYDTNMEIEKLNDFAFLQPGDELHIHFETDTDKTIYKAEQSIQHITKLDYKPNSQITFDPNIYPLQQSYMNVKDVEYNKINFNFSPISGGGLINVLSVTVGGKTTDYYEQIPGFITGTKLNMFRYIEKSLYELLTFETDASATATPISGNEQEYAIKNKTSTIIEIQGGVALVSGINTAVDLTLDINYGLYYSNSSTDPATKKVTDTVDIVEQIEYSDDVGKIVFSDNYTVVNFIKEFSNSDLKTDFPISMSHETIDTGFDKEHTTRVIDEIDHITKDGQEIYSEENIITDPNTGLQINTRKLNFEYYTAKGIRDIRTTESYKHGDVSLGDVMGVVNKYIDNENNEIITSDKSFGFKGKYFTYPYPIEYTDPEKTASEEELKKSIAGDVIGYLDDDGNFVESYYTSYDNDNTLDFEIVNTSGITKYNNKYSFERVWRRIILDTKSYANYNLDNIIAVDFVKRTIPIKDNVYKTFKVGVDLLNTKFGINDFLYSYAKFTNATSIIDKPYYELVDLEIKDVGFFERLELGNQGFDDPVKIKYFINYISHFKPGLIVNSTNYGFNTYSVKFKDTDFILETINKDLFGISYNTPIQDPDNFYSKGSRIKMIVELK